MQAMSAANGPNDGDAGRLDARWASGPSAKETMRTLLLDPASPYRLTPAVVDHLVAHSQITDWRAERRMVAPDDTTDLVHFLVAGSVRIEVHGERGRWTIGAFVPPGRFIGSLLPSPAAHASFVARTHEAALVALVSHATIHRVLQALPLDRSLRLVSYHTDCLRALFAARCVMPWTSIPTRLVHALRGLARDFGRSIPGGTLIALPLTHKHLARCIIASRSNVSRALGRLRRLGVIDVVDRHIVLLSRDG